LLLVFLEAGELAAAVSYLSRKRGILRIKGVQRSFLLPVTITQARDCNQKQ
jgi:hypothetical protein